MPIKYNIELLRSLNKEYESKKFMSFFTQYDQKSQLEQAASRIDELSTQIDFSGKKILEIGCGRGHVAYQLANKFDCTVVGLEVYPRPEWEGLQNPNLKFMHLDLGLENPFGEGEFDIILSFVVWEHIRHPRTVLWQAAKILKEGGFFYLSANLYRSAVASHLYRQIHFPFPHLLFDDEIVTEFALENGVAQHSIDAFYHVNKLVYAQYKEYFRELNLEIISEKKSIRKLDMDLYKRFEDKLGLYPIADLELDFFHVLLKKQNNDEAVEKDNVLALDLAKATDVIRTLRKRVQLLESENRDYRWKMNYIIGTWYGRFATKIFRFMVLAKRKLNSGE